MDRAERRSASVGPVHQGRLGDPAGAIAARTSFAGEGAGLYGTAGNLTGGGPMFRAYDKKTGEIVFEFKLPGNQNGMPMTYMQGGKQYVVVAIGDSENGPRRLPAELIALTVGE